MFKTHLHSTAHRNPGVGRAKRWATGLIVAGFAALSVTACGGGASPEPDSPASGETQTARLLLDFTPNPVHIGIYQADHDGDYAAEGLELEIQTPTSAADVMRLLAAGKVDFGIMEANDLIAQVGEGQAYRGIYAIIQRPLSGLATRQSDNVESPKQLEGKKVGVVGNPNTAAMLKSMVESDGGDLSKIEQITIGFAGAKALAAGQVDAFSGFATDAAQAATTGTATDFLYSYEWGVPEYPSLVLVTTEQAIEEKPDFVRAFVAATNAGYTKALEDPEAALDILLEANPALDREANEAQLEAALPAMNKPGLDIGEISLTDMEALLAWAQENELFTGEIDLETVVTNEFRE